MCNAIQGKSFAFNEKLMLFMDEIELLQVFS